jgi:hypothetical protein
MAGSNASTDESFGARWSTGDRSGARTRFTVFFEMPR